MPQGKFDINLSENAPDLFPEERNIWDRQPGETRIAFNFFRIFRDMGESRTISKVVEQLNEKGKGLKYAYDLSHRFAWRKRIAAWEGYLDKKRQEAKIKEIEDMVKRHSQHAQALETALLVPVDKFIQKFRNDPHVFDNMTVGDLLELVYSSADRFPKIVDSERKSRGVPTEISKQDITSDGEKLEPVLNIVINGSRSPLLRETLNAGNLKENTDNKELEEVEVDS